MPLKEIRLRLGPAEAGRTLAAVIKAAGGLSHAAARGLIEHGLARLNGEAIRKPVHRVAEGDLLEVRFDPETRYREKGEPRPGDGFTVVHEDPDLVVLDKEAGVPTVPVRPGAPGALVERVLDMYASRGVRSPRLWVVHRIDRFTSGLVLAARSAAAAERLKEQFRARSARREYLAVCEGIPEPPSGRLVSRLLEDPVSLKVRVAKGRTQGKEAITHYRVRVRFAGAALLEITLETGRRNQIRVQMAAAGHPLVGDRAYGRNSRLIKRVALHAARLGFEHPRSGKPILLESPLPSDMRALIGSLERGAELDTPPGA